MCIDFLLTIDDFYKISWQNSFIKEWFVSLKGNVTEIKRENGRKIFHLVVHWPNEQEWARVKPGARTPFVSFTWMIGTKCLNHLLLPLQVHKQRAVGRAEHPGTLIWDAVFANDSWSCWNAIADSISDF